MIEYEELGKAAFDNDARANEGHGIASILSSLGFHAADAVKAAEQRALRMVLAARGPHEIERMREQAYAGRYSTEELSEEEQAQLEMFKAVWIDGLAVSAQATRTANDA